MLALLAPNQYPFYTASLLCLILLSYLLRRPRIPGVKALTFVLLTILLWTLGSAFEDSSSLYSTKILWHKFSQTGMNWLVLMWVIFITGYVCKEFKWKARYLLLLSVIPGAVTLLTWTNDLHELLWKSLLVSTNNPAHPIIVQYTATTIGTINLIYLNVLCLLSTVLLVWRLTQAHGQLLRQVLILLLCTLVPWAAHLSYLFSANSLYQTDPTPYLFNFSSILFAIGLLRYRLLNIVPVGFQSLIASLPDGVIVLSLENRIEQLNPAAETILDRTARAMIGQPIEVALANHPDLLEPYLASKTDVLRNITLNTSDGANYFELRISPLRDSYGYAIGQIISLRNITKRIQAENASRHSQMLLRTSEEKYRTLIENITEVLYTMDMEGRFTYISSAIEHLTGLPADTLLGKSFRDYIHPEDLPALEENLNLIFSGQLQTLEFRILDRNGDIHWARAYCRFLIQNDKPVGLQGFVTDITEHKQVEQALERRASQLTMLNIIGEQIAAVIELKSVLDNAPRLIKKHFGYYHVAIFTPDYARGELVMRSTSGAFSEFFPENHHLKFGQGMIGWAANNRSTILANDVRLEPRYTNLFPDKIFCRSELAVPIRVGVEMVGVLDIQSPIINAFDDNDVRVMETIADQIAIAIENARLYEEVRRQLKEREQKENMLRIQRDLLFRLSSAKRLEDTLQTAVETLAVELHANRVAISLVDWECQSIQPVVSQGYPQNYPNPPTPLDQNIAGWVARNGQASLISDIGSDTSGLEFPPGTLAMLCVPLTSNNKVIGVICLESEVPNAFSQDDLRMLTILANSLITLIERARLFEEVERARAELEKRATALEEANASLRELDRLKSQFLANMSHELRTPLNSIIGFSEVLVDELNGPLNADQKEFLQDILDSGTHLLSLINDLLDFSKIEAGAMALEPSVFEIKNLFEELRVTISPLIEKKSQVLVFRQDGPLPPFTADHLRIKQVFINLLSNANKFTPEHGTITALCRLVEPGWLLFSITDTGIGIQPNDQELIFEDFRQVDGSMTREVAGTGLGLAISKRIVEMHHGQIWVESALGKGATFFVKMPVCCS